MEKIRRYDLDWLRVLVFALLILYHVGMYYVPWGWHLKSDPSYPQLRWPMLFVNQWRLPILFVISGMGTAFALGYRTSGMFVKERFFRLVIPLAFGMIFIIPPQVWAERVAVQGQQYSYWEFWTSAYFNGVYPEGNFSWHHLWFLPYLFIYSLLFAPLFVMIRNRADSRLMKKIGALVTKGWPLYWIIIPLYLFEALLEPFFPVTHALIGDWFTLINYAYLFFIGFILIQVKDSFYHGIQKIGKHIWIIAIASFIAYYMIKQYEDSTVIHFIEALIKVFNLWSWILLLFYLAQRYLNKKSQVLAYANRAVYPFYILHQTITILLIYHLSPYDINIYIESILLTIGTFGICYIIYELVIRRIRLLHPLFGLKS